MPQRSPRRTRGKGEGSIYQRDDGRWVGEVERPRSSGGRRRRARIVRRTRQEVIDGLPALRARVASGGVSADSTTTVDAYLRYWLTEVKTSEVSDRSIAIYTNCIERAKPHIGNVRLAKVAKPHVQSLVNGLVADGYAPKTIKTTLTMLRQAFTWAIPDLVSHNPAVGVKGPKATKTIDDTLTYDETLSVLAAAQGDRYEALYWLALKYGLRIGELTGLRWADVDLDADSLTVRKSKTAAGERTVPLLPEAKAVLTTHRRRQSVQAIDGWVFVAPRGGRIHDREVTRLWNELLERVGIEHRCRECGTGRTCYTTVRRFHASRHTAATLLLNAGVPLEVVSAILGHAKIAITADLYARVQSDLKRKGLETLG